MKIKSESLATRCDICHQADKFNPATGHCSRCTVSIAPTKKVFDVKELIWDLQRQNDLYITNPQKFKSSRSPEQLQKIQNHYQEWRNENYHQYEAELNDFLVRSLLIDISIIKKCTMYQKLEMYKEVETDLERIRSRQVIWFAMGLFVLPFGIYMFIYPVIFISLFVTLLYCYKLFIKSHSDKCFERLNKYWWRDINNDTQAIINSYKSESES